MSWLQKIRQLDYPKIGRFIILFMLCLEASLYIYLIIANQQSQSALALSSCLLVSSVLTLIAVSLSIPLRFYYNHWIAYFVLGSLSIVGRVVAIAWLIILNLQVSGSLFITQDGYAGFLRTALIFIILQSVLLFEKCKYYRTKKQVEEALTQKMIGV